MRLHRIRVEHVRGLPAAEVHFAAAGATVVEAPNESGKTTLFDAFDLLLREKHSTTKQVVKDLQPADRDVGSTVEAELTIDGTHLTIRKCFNRDRATVLTIHAPSPRQVTGHEAHDELRRILEDGTDLALFEALRFHQGRALDSVTLGDSEHLARRLDATAGGSGDTGDDALYERILAQFQRYFTPTGQPGRDLKDADARLADARTEVDRLAAMADELEDAGRRAEELHRRRDELEAALAALEPELETHQQQLAQVASLRAELRTAEAQRKALAAEHAQAETVMADRRELLASIDELRERLTGREAAHDAAETRWREQAGRLDELAAAVEAAEETEAGARAALRSAQVHADLERRREELRVALDRRSRIEQALTAAAEADAFLADDPLTGDRLARIRSASEALRLADARLDDAAPTVHVASFDDLSVELDGERIHLGPGERIDRAVPGRVRIELPDRLRVDVRAGTSLEERRTERDAAARELTAACAAAGVEDAAAAEELERTRQRHREALRERDVVVDRELGDETREGLDDRVRRLRTLVGELEQQLASDAAQLALVTDAGDADGAAALPALEAAEQAARDATRATRADHDGLVGEVARLRDLATRRSAELDAARHELDATLARLDERRASRPDDALRTTLAETSAALGDAEATLADVRGRFDALQPEEIELLAETATRRRDRHVQDLDACRQELAGVRAMIEVRGGNGVGEALQLAQAEHDRVAEANRSLHARARAARTLKEAFERARDEAYAAYREPLRQRIVAAGRLVFGEDLDVELDERLAVVTRSLGGVTLPFAQLSAGAREQLAILTALAAADLAGDDGVPLVLDDTLGYTDNTRLERLGAVLGRVRGPQVVVLTCVSARFHAVAGAEVVRLREVTTQP